MREDFERVNWVPEPIPTEHIPKANIYIRPAQNSDLRQIADIYNHYVKHTIHTCELDATDENEWRDRLTSIDEEKLAFLVAVSKSSKGQRGHEGPTRGGRHGRGRGAGGNQNRPHVKFHENVLGFAFAEDYAGLNTIYQFTAELQLFVHPEHYRVGIGKTLMDRMIPSLDPMYMSRGGTDFIADNRIMYEVGGKRDIRKVIINIGYHTGEDKDFKWQKNWLQENWEFEHVGTLSNIGVKFDRG